MFAKPEYYTRNLFGNADKKVMHTNICEMLDQLQGRVFDQGDPNTAYEMGVHFGTVDTLHKMLDLLEHCPAYSERPLKSWHHS